MNICRLKVKTPGPKKNSGWTLPEMMVGVLAGLMMLSAVATSYIFMLRTFDATGNYEELDRHSRNALDVISSDIRQCGHMTNYTTNSISFTNLDGSLLQYTWDTSNLLTYTNASVTLAGCPRGGVLLTNCTYLLFTIFQRNPSNGTTMTFWPAPTTNPALTKVVVMDWYCKRTNYTTLMDAESIQTAKVVMRN